MAKIDFSDRTRDQLKNIVSRNENDPLMYGVVLAAKRELAVRDEEKRAFLERRRIRLLKEPLS